MDDAIAMETVDATQPTVAMEPVGAEPCPHCGVTLALDQRYCLECGAPRTYLSGMLLERLRTPPAPEPQPASPVGAGAFATAPSSAWQRGNALTLIAGIGVLLLAMGVGVLIGRSGDSSGSGSAAPQVISVGGAPSTGAASTSTTPSTTTPEVPAATKSGAGSSSKHKGKAAESSGGGSSPGKPAPPAVLKNLRTGSGQSYEQKSKNLPNVVSTG
jgi:hypothetical protein